MENSENSQLELVKEYYPELSADVLARLQRWSELFREWNSKINLISRKDMEHLEEHHLLHSLAMGRLIPFPARSRVLDVGTGGGLPGVPLAICHPQVKFFLLDSIAKKVNAVRAMVEELGLRNVEVVHKRAELLESKWDFVLGRAVTALPVFLGWIGKNMRVGGTEEMPFGVLYLKGSLYEEELAAIRLKPHAVHDLHELYPRAYYEGKYLIHLNAADVKRAEKRIVNYEKPSVEPTERAES